MQISIGGAKYPVFGHALLHTTLHHHAPYGWNNLHAQTQSFPRTNRPLGDSMLPALQNPCQRLFKVDVFVIIYT